MAKSDARFEYRAKLPRTDHDLSQPFGFTCAPGMLLPIWFDLATPGDTYYVRHNLDFLRTNPLIAPAMVDVKVHYETFFVPLQMIYQPIENSVFSIKPILSSLYDSSQLRNQLLPLVDYSQLLANAEQIETLPNQFGMRRLFDLFEFNETFLIPAELTGDRRKGFPLFPCAYQCIYQHYYRLDDKEEFVNTAFNLDRFYNHDISIEETAQMDQMMFLRYRPWDFDYFTSSYRSPIVSNANAMHVLPSSNYSPLTDSLTAARGKDGSNTVYNERTHSFGPNYGGTYSDESNFRVINTAAIRQMFANEKLAMITGRTRKNYDSQVLAHFGVDVPHDVKHDISLIGSDVYDLRVGEVTSLASTELSPLGEIAGKAWSMGKSEQPHKFTAPCHGVVMTIFSVEPKKRYFGTTNRLHFLTSALDIPTPEFDRLGNQPMFAYESCVGNDKDHMAVDHFTDVIAWKERFYQNKRKAPRVTRAFMHWADIKDHKPTGNLNPYSAYFVSSVPFARNNEQVISQPNLLDSYLIDPTSINELMLVPYLTIWQNGDTSLSGQTGENWNEHPYMAYQRDPFIVDSRMDVKKISWMSKDGEPIYD